MEAEQCASDAGIRRNSRRFRRGEHQSPGTPSTRFERLKKAVLRQTLNSYARLIWVRLPSAIFQQLSIQQTAGKTGKLQVKIEVDARSFKTMIVRRAAHLNQMKDWARRCNEGKNSQNGRQMHH
jgi:hypothetical protein